MKSEPIQIRVTEEFKTKLREASIKQGVTMSKIIVKAIEQYIDGYQEPENELQNIKNEISELREKLDEVILRF